MTRWANRDHRHDFSCAFATARPQPMLTHLLGNRTHPLVYYPCIDPCQDTGPRVKAPKCEGGWAKNSPPPRFLGQHAASLPMSNECPSLPPVQRCDLSNGFGSDIESANGSTARRRPTGFFMSTAPEAPATATHQPQDDKQQDRSHGCIDNRRDDAAAKYDSKLW